MKTIFLYFFLTTIMSVVGQNNYLQTTITANSQETYVKQQIKSGSWLIYNKTNIKQHQPIKYTDGRTLSGVYSPTVAPADERQLQRAVQETFTEQEIQSFKMTKKVLGIGFVINPQTGITEEVSFVIPDNPIYCAVTMSKFEILERKIKQYVHWCITPNSKQFTHIIMATGYFYN